MRSQLYTSGSILETELVQNKPTVFNDDDVNRMLGWVLAKVKSSRDLQYDEKEMILKDMSVV